MTTILLSNYGTFLSGRSLPSEIIEKEVPLKGSVVTLDFKGIPAANQSFLNQLFLELYKRGYSKSDITIINECSSMLSSRVRQQMSIVFDGDLRQSEN